ncbi:HyaD/HybD family hydrogenase maturation endopeptidase [Paracraurococcus lichenis]|uniref:HyaD/HybD family hydrogenase maturation endopeptidase n=1 Tax=Paracraurococcus lichenis TaxID=3064888 RepID=A0ABT9DZJ5_9PROT|nr:HyaD/HybD family hydrogenase maturation endopeptidase [Paracraurococcus sp. LOR1-02]MDO9709329.1 HyaD/HybD family hydrogenase maturation endopeptidase [Paracraurococcus sp. LOR1-02]
MTLPADPAACECLVLGIGNLLWADEGFGVRCVEALHRGWRMAPGVALMDGGTQGLYLVHHIRAARRLIVFDAIDYGDEPGRLRLVRDGEVPAFGGVRKMSLHQTGFQDVLIAAEMLGGGPERILLVGVQAGELEDYGGSLTPPVRAQMGPALMAALAQLTDWGLPAVPRPEEEAVAPLLGPGLGLSDYEGGRPGPEQAWRRGDARFLAAD